PARRAECWGRPAPPALARSAVRGPASHDRAGGRWMGMMLPPFQQLVDDHWRHVARLCAALAAPGEGEDAAQRAWLQALDAYPSLRHARKLRGRRPTVRRRAGAATTH